MYNRMRFIELNSEIYLLAHKKSHVTIFIIKFFLGFSKYYDTSLSINSIHPSHYYK